MEYMTDAPLTALTQFAERAVAHEGISRGLDVPQEGRELWVAGRSISTVEWTCQPTGRCWRQGDAPDPHPHSPAQGY